MSVWRLVAVGADGTDGVSGAGGACRRSSSELRISASPREGWREEGRG
jgi:glycerate-2-kinase